MLSQNRRYDVVLLGATGYTGGLVAEYLHAKSPTELRWAVAGKSLQKLELLQEKLKQADQSRLLPAIELLELKSKELSNLAQRTRIMINAIGPYSVHGSLVMEACATNGTNYLDFCTETPWISEMINKYHEVAKRNSAKIIPAIGNSSSPSDLMAYLLATQFHRSYNSTLKDAICSFNMKVNGMSAGSIASVTTVIARYGAGPLLIPNPYLLCPTKTRSPSTSARPFPTRTLGYFRHGRLGSLTTSFAAAGNTAVIQRSRYLRPSLYNSAFSYEELMPVNSVFQAILIHLATKLAILLLTLPPFRALINFLRPTPGTGPLADVCRNENIELHVCGIDDVVATQQRPARTLMAEYSYHGPMYYHSALLAAEAAMTLLELEKVRGNEYDEQEELYGILTPSCLGGDFIQRLRGAGVKIEVSSAPIKKDD